MEDLTRDRIGPEGGAALEAQGVRQLINVAEGIVIKIRGNIDSLGNSLIDTGLNNLLHFQMLGGRNVAGTDKRGGQGIGICRGAP